MVLDSFATPAQMEARSQGAVPATAPFLSEALAAASTRIRNRCGWHVFPRLATTEYRVRGRAGHHIWLPTTYLVTVDMMNVGGALVPLDDVEWFEDGRVDYFDWRGLAKITFTHGYEEPPADLIALTLELALGDLLSRGVIREQTLASSVTWARASGRLTSDDENSLAEYTIGYQP